MCRSLRQSRYSGRRLRTATSRYGAYYEMFLVVVLAVLASVQGRAVNISNTWVLPEEGFPVFYRYFRDRISWYEADAVCQFHHANLVTVDTTAQYDAVRAYLKELDISSAVWVGLIRSNPDGDFTWTDYRGLSGEGYWSSAPDARSAPLCAAADPAADYRWEARACGGPTVASFICELPVPQWALGNEGCMVRALPALTILYLPESAAVQLTADCGMAGVKKVQCTGNVKREELLKELSCADEEELSTASFVSTVSGWPATSDATFTDQDTTNEVTTEESIATEHEIDINHHETTITSIPHFIYSQTQYKTPVKIESVNKSNNILLSKNINLEDNNLQSNFIPKSVEEDNVLTSDQLEKLEDDRHKQHKMLHEEIARVGNVDNIFTQPTDHFIPPLVMAKAKISDDMTVLSLAEKHAQQLAEKQFNKENLNNAEAADHSYSDSYKPSGKLITGDTEKPLIATIKPIKWRDNKKDILKNHSPKKYTNQKYNVVKSKILKLTESKLVDVNKSTTNPASITTTTSHSEEIKIDATEKQNLLNDKTEDTGDNFGIDLTVILNDAPLTSEEHSSYSGDVAKLETIQNRLLNHTEYEKSSTTSKSPIDIMTTPETKISENITANHEIIKITVISNDDSLNNATVFEITTKMPIFKDNVLNITTSPFPTTNNVELNNTENRAVINGEKTHDAVVENGSTLTPITHLTSTISAALATESLSTVQPIFTSTEAKSTTFVTSEATQHVNVTEHIVEEKNISTTALPVQVLDFNNNTNLNDTASSNESFEKIDLNSAEYHELLVNMTDHRQIEEEDTTDSDFQSPLLSGVIQPVHRPPRTRRPQQPNRNKFNPFRILG